MDKRKKNVLGDNKKSKKIRFTVENWLRSSQTTNTIEDDNSITDQTESQITYTEENDQSLRRRPSNRETDEFSAGTFFNDQTEFESNSIEDNENEQRIVGSADQADVEIQSDQSNVSSSSRIQAEQFTLPDCFEKVGTGRKNIRCKVCFSQINVVSIFVHNGKHHIPVICSEKGDQNRKTTVEKHLQSQCHKSAVHSQKLASLRTDQLVDECTI